MDLQLEYRIKEYGSPTPANWTVADDTDLNSDFQKLEFEAIHNDYEDLLISGSLPFEINGNLFSAVYSYLVAHDYKAVNSIECRLKVIDTACGCDDYLNLYGVIRAIDVGDICIKDGKFKDCFKIKIKFERKEAELLKVTLIDTDQLTNPTAYHADFKALPHPELHYQVDRSNGYLWTVLLFLIPVALFSPIVGIPIVGVAILLAIVALYGSIINAIAGNLFAEKRGSNKSAQSPYHVTYIDNLWRSSALTGLSDFVFTSPTKLIGKINFFAFFYTKGINHPTIPNVEFAYLNWAGEDYLRWVNKRFEAKWRLINNVLHIRYKEQDYLGSTFFDMRGIDYCIENITDLAIAGSTYDLTEDATDTIGGRAANWYAGRVSYTNNQVSDTQKGLNEERFEDAPCEFRNSGRFADPYTAADNFFSLSWFPVVGAVISNFFFNTLLPAFEVGKDDGKYIFIGGEGTASRFLTNPKLVEVNQLDNTLVVNKPYLAGEINRGVQKGYDPVNFAQPNVFNYNYTVPIDQVLDTFTENTFRLQNDDPRITKPEGVRTYEIPLNCSTLDVFGFLQSSAFDTAIDLYVDITNLDGSDGIGEVRSIVVNFKEGKIFVKVKRVNYI